MTEIKRTKAQLEKRRDEINEQLARVNRRLEAPLDHDMQEQAIEVEQEEVPAAMEANLRAELNQIEDKLLDYDE